MSLEQVWNAPIRIERDSKIAFADRMNILFPYIDKIVCDRISVPVKDFYKQLELCKVAIINRSSSEIDCLNKEIEVIKNYSKQQAIDELIKSRKINEKISTIQTYMKSL